MQASTGPVGAGPVVNSGSHMSIHSEVPRCDNTTAGVIQQAERLPNRWVDQPTLLVSARVWDLRDSTQVNFLGCSPQIRLGCDPLFGHKRAGQPLSGIQNRQGLNHAQVRNFFGLGRLQGPGGGSSDRCSGGRRSGSRPGYRVS